MPVSRVIGDMANRSSIAAAIVAAAAVVLLLPSMATAERVTVSRDSHGEPHIRAATAAGAMYGLAQAQMEDQGAYILGGIASANGRSAELSGPECLPKCFVSDQTIRLLKIPETALGNFSNLPPDVQGRLRAFTQGINDYIGDYPHLLPVWARTVTPEEVLASISYPFLMGQLTKAVGGATDFESGADDGSGTTAASYMSGPGAVEQKASNAFVVAGSRTASGKPILVGDPHVSFEGATRWYGASLTYPGTKVRGVTLRGAPGIAIGANEHVAWSHTANHGNTYENQLYREQLDPGRPDSYLYGGVWEPMEVRNVPIKVQTGPGIFSTVNVRMRYTIHGPVISDPLAIPDGTQASPGTSQALSAALSLFNEYRLVEQITRQNDARSLDEFKAALAMNQSSGFHTLAAGASGIFYTSGGRNALIRGGLNIRQPLDGTDPSATWQGIMPFDQVPQAESPASGWLQNANNSPWYSAPGVISKETVPYQLARADVNGPRSRRLLDVLPNVSGLDAAGSEALAEDTFVEFVPTMKALLAQAAVAGSVKVKAGSELIQAWDGRADADSTAFPLFATWLRGLDESSLGFKFQNPPGPSTVFSGTQLVTARQSMNKAYDGMIARYGRIDVALGDLRKVGRGNFTGPVSGGDFDVPALRMAHCKGQPGAGSPVAYQPCVASGGSSFTFDIDMGDPYSLRYNRPVSNTDDPSSPFISRNTEDFSAGTFRVMPVTDSQVMANRVSFATRTIPGTSPRGFKALSRRVKAGRRGRTKIRFWCPASQPAAGGMRVSGRCSGWFKARAVVKVRKRTGGYRRVQTVVGFRRLNLKPRANTVGLRLNGKGRKLLKKKHLLRIRLTMRLNLLDDHAWSGQRLILRRAGQGEVSSRPASRASIASDEPSMGMSSAIPFGFR